jgi:hypothetical protein
MPSDRGYPQPLGKQRKPRAIPTTKQITSIPLSTKTKCPGAWERQGIKTSTTEERQHSQTTGK